MEPGELFHQRYRIVGRLGTGGQSNVYRADELATGRRVAIKMLHDHGDGVRFIREGRVVSRLKSPHTVRLIEFDRAESGQFFLVFEFVAGEHLGEVARREGPLPWPRVARFMRGVLVALAEAHELGIVHRDIKPSNIMIAPGDEVRVLDFGVARLDEGDPGNALTLTGEVLGTPRYVSPESLAGAKVTAAADVYAVGLVAWELLVGHPANTERNSADIVLRHLDPTPFRLPTELDLPNEARRWVTSLCNKNAERRPPDAAAALSELDEFDAAPASTVSQVEVTADTSSDVAETMVLSADSPVLAAEGAAPRAIEPSPDVDPTDPDPWEPPIDPTEPDPWAPAADVFSDAAPPPPPPQPASSGIPYVAATERPHVPRAPIEQPAAPHPLYRPLWGLVVLAAILVVVSMLWLMLR